MEPEMSEAALALTQSLEGYYLPQLLKLAEPIKDALWWAKVAAIVYIIDTILFKRRFN